MKSSDDEKIRLLESLVDELSEALQDVTLDELMRDGRELRVKLLKEQYGIDAEDDE